MPRILLTAFEPYDRWKENASWSTLVELTRWYEGPAELVTRRYPVELTSMSQRLRADLQTAYDHVILCGQAPGSSFLRLESVSLNVRTDGTELIAGGPAAYKCNLPLTAIAAQIRSAGVPARMSHHAGTYLCNAALYLSQHYLRSMDLATPSLFVHIPLMPSQVALLDEDSPSMSSALAGAAMAILIESLCAAPAMTDPYS
ncbi:MAG: pyroglutamyl-peptidase I [Planctomycetota bacterium]